MDIDYERKNHCFSVVSEVLKICSGLIFNCLVDP